MTLPKGPWKAGLFAADLAYAKIRDGEGDDMAGISCYRTDVRVDELARAICALPALIEAARMLTREPTTASGYEMDQREGMRALRAALRGVDGEEPPA